MRINIVLIITAGLCINLCSGGQDKKQYSYKFEVGQQYYIKHIMQRKIEPKIGLGKGLAIEQNFSFGYQVIVRQVDKEGWAWLKCRYDWVSIHQKDSEKEVSYDSAKNDDNISPLLWGYRALLGEVFQIKISKLGEIEQIKGFIEVHQSVKEKLNPNLGKKQMVRQIQNQFNDLIMRELLTNLTNIYTDKKVGKGDSWRKKFETSYDAELEFNNKFKINDITDDGFAVIGVETKIRTKFGANPVIRDSVKRKSKSTGSQTGTIRIKESTGEIISSDINLKMTTVTNITSSQVGMPKPDNVVVVGSTHFEFIKIADPRTEFEDDQPDL